MMDDYPAIPAPTEADLLLTRPAYQQRASASTMKEIIRGVLEEQMKGQTYQVGVFSITKKYYCLRATECSSRRRSSPTR